MPGMAITQDDYGWPDHHHPKFHGSIVGGVIEDCRACLRCHLEAGYAMGFLEGTRARDVPSSEGRVLAPTTVSTEGGPASDEHGAQSPLTGGSTETAAKDSDDPAHTDGAS